MDPEPAPAEAEPRLDPRFDPAFQRGFTGAVTTGRRRPLAGSAAATPPLSPRAEAAEPPRVFVSQTPDASAPVPSAPVPAVTTATVDDDVLDEAPRPRVNGFVVALLVVGVALILASVGLAQYAARVLFDSSSSRDQAGLAFAQMAYVAAPYAALLGIGTLIGVLFLFAVRRDRR